MRINVAPIENYTFKLIVLYGIVPIVSRAISAYLTTYSYMLISLLTVVLIVFAEKKASFNLYSSLILPFLLFELLTYFTTWETAIMWGYQVLLFLLPVIVSFYILQNRRYLIDTLAKIIFWAVLITTVTTIIGVIQYPNAARTLATVDSGQNEYAVLYSWRNIGGYGFVYTVVLLYPMMILAYKRKKINTTFTVICTLAIFMLAIYTEYTIALLFVILSSALFFFKRDLKSSDLIILVVVALIFFILFNTVLSGFFDWLSDVLQSEKMSERLDALSDGRTGLENAEDNRFELYLSSINTFMRHPLLGTFLGGGGGGIGGHSFTLDALAQYGILGGACMWCMYRKIYRVFLRPFSRMKGYGYILWAFIQAIMMSTINTGAWIEALALYIPILATVIYKDDIGDAENEGIVDC